MNLVYMKTKIYLGILSFVLGLSLASCSEDDDYTIHTTPILNESSVVTGSSDVTATTATLHATLSGLDGMDAGSYKTGFFYGFAQDNLPEDVQAAYDGSAFSAQLNGLNNNSTLYYQAYVCLQGKVYYKGEVKSLLTTDAKVATADAASVDFASAVLGGTLTDATADATCGVVISTSSDVEAVRAGLIVKSEELKDSYSFVHAGLVPETQYYYAAYLNLGSGIVYGEVKSFTTPAYDFDLDNDLVDLGLSVKWARFNVGAKSETGLGGLFGFGDLTGCNNSIDPADYASADTYKTASDLAFRAFQGRATLPTADDFEELFTLCQKEWTEQNGVTGFKFTGPNGNSIFLPAAGTRVANDVTALGTEGYYLTGTVNSSNTEFAVGYQFAASVNHRITAAVYQGMAVRAVSTAKNVPFNKALLYQKWYLDNGQDGKQHVFEGPFTQWGVTDNWSTVSNGQPNIEQQIHWEMGTGNGWIGYTYGKDYGYMELKEDGTVNIHRIAEDGTVTDETGKFTIDEANKVIDIDINVLCANTWIGTKSGKLNILSLTADGLQIALPDGDYGYSLNYYSQAKADADAQISVLLNIADSSWGGSWDEPLAAISPEKLAGQHTFVFEGACTDAMVFTLDFAGMAKRYPNSFVRIDEIKLDGTSIRFDANRFYYGDIEGNGKYRVQLFNAYGAGSVGNAVPLSPFSNVENQGTEPAIHFKEKLEIVCTVITDGTGAGIYTPNLVTVNPDWGSAWGYNAGATFEVKYENFQYSLVASQFDIKYESADYAAGSIMTFVEVADIYKYFPGLHATLDNLYLDGKEVTFDASKVLDANESPKYRLELWNCYGVTKDKGCAFGTPDGDVIKELGFSSSMEVKFTFHTLFSVPEW